MTSSSDIVEVLRSLIQLQSFSSEEEALAEWIHNWCKERGMDVEIVDKNVIVNFKGADSSGLFIFNGHMDTVGPGDVGEWTHPPLGEKAGVVEDGKIYGLGSSDMKASLATFLVLAEQYQETPPPVDVVFAFVTEEETSGDGSKRFQPYFNKKLKPKGYKHYGSIVGEPTSFDYMEIGNRGCYFLELEVKGEACHASRAAGKDTNSPERALRAIQKSDELLKGWIEKYADDLLGVPALTITSLKTSPSSPNQVPSSTTIRWDLRTTPDLDSGVIQEMKEQLAEFGELKFVTDPCPAAKAPDEALVMTAIEKACPGVVRQPAKGGNDCWSLISLGVPAVTFAPGKKEVIHCVDEYCPVDDLKRAQEVYSSVVSEFSKLI